MAFRAPLEITPLAHDLNVATRNFSSGQNIGNYKSVFRGSGLEFENYRAYMPDDDASMIDWKASARANQLLVRQFTEERNLETFFMVDASSSMVFGSCEKLKSQYAAELVASLAYSILQSGDMVGLFLYNDSVRFPIRMAGGPAQFQPIVNTLADPAHYGGGSDFSGALKRLSPILRKPGAVVFIVSDFLHLTDGWREQLKIIGRRYDVIGVMVRDIRDEHLPEGFRSVVVEDPYSDEQMLVDVEKIKPRFEALARQQHGEVRKAFLQAGADFMELSTDTPFSKPLMKFLKQRSAKLR